MNLLGQKQFGWLFLVIMLPLMAALAIGLFGFSYWGGSRKLWLFASIAVAFVVTNGALIFGAKRLSERSNISITNFAEKEKS